jgi:hypothetical protein
MSVKAKSLLAAVALAATGVIGAQTASAATAPPTVKMTQPTFGDIAPDGDAASYPETWSGHFTLHYSVTAPAGVCAQSITYQDYDTLGGDPDPLIGGNSYTETDRVKASARSYTANMYWLDFYRGGFTAVIRAKDCHGVTGASNVVHAVIQPGDDLDAAMTYAGAFKVAHCTCFPGGTSHYTSTKNASVSFRTAKPIDASGVELALIMPKGPGRGSAAVYIDNKYKATINTYHAGPNINGQIVYQVLLPGTATHAVKIVNLATAGHPRIDLDATINGG